MTKTDDVVVITGASGGIGRALAFRLAGDKKRIVLAARRAAELKQVAGEVMKRGAADVLEVPTDVTKRDAVNALRDAAIEKFGAIDVWINNAGRGITKQTLDLTDDDVDEMMSVNVKSALYGMQAVIPHFISREKGHLINISSFLGRVPVSSYRSAYSASKAALNSLTANVRMDLLARYPNIHVTLVMPGVVSTEFAVNAETPDELRVDIPGQSRGAPVQTPEEAAESIAEVIEHPVAEMFTNPWSADRARDYFANVPAFEAMVAGPK
jgi:short-subunit dehydrogenase